MYSLAYDRQYYGRWTFVGVVKVGLNKLFCFITTGVVNNFILVNTEVINGKLLLNCYALLTPVFVLFFCGLVAADSTPDKAHRRYTQFLWVPRAELAELVWESEQCSETAGITTYKQSVLFDFLCVCLRVEVHPRSPDIAFSFCRAMLCKCGPVPSCMRCLSVCPCLVRSYIL